MARNEQAVRKEWIIIDNHPQTSSCCSIYCRIQSAWDGWHESRASSPWQPLVLTKNCCTSSSVFVDGPSDGVQSSRATDMTETEAPNAL